jgi:tetraacyldisaccharide 4'-kinase
VAATEPTYWLARARVVAWAGIGAPERFFAMLESLGAAVVERRAYRDHQRLGEADAEQLLALAQRHAAILVTTAKDAARLRGESGGLAHLAATSRVLAIEASLAPADAERLMSLVDTALRAGSK